MIYFFHELISFLNSKKSWKSKRLFKIDPVYRNNLHHMIQVSFDDIDALFRPLKQNVRINCHWIYIFCTLNC